MSSSIRRVATVALAILVGACSSDHATAPQQMSAPTVEPSAALIGDLTGTLGLSRHTAIQRTRPLPHPITVSETIGWNGGTLSIPEAGVTVTVPRGALSSNTVITMTARAGSLLAYDFAPHGITFARPLTFTQSLRNTNVTLPELPFLSLAYYTDPSLLGRTTALVSELISGVQSLADWSFTAPINHFSGYIVTCGRGEAVSDY